MVDRMVVTTVGRLVACWVDWLVGSMDAMMAALTAVSTAATMECRKVD